MSCSDNNRYDTRSTRNNRSGTGKFKVGLKKTNNGHIQSVLLEQNHSLASCKHIFFTSFQFSTAPIASFF